MRGIFDLFTLCVNSPIECTKPIFQRFKNVVALNAPVPENLITVTSHKDITVMSRLYVLAKAEITEKES